MLAAIFIIIGLILLVFIHELGHFAAAKQAGIKVEEFGFGFPPRIFAWRSKALLNDDGTLRRAQGETEYSFNWLPLGGFVRIYGENKVRANQEAGETGVPVDVKRAFYAQSLWRRFVVIAAGISINFIAGWLLLSLVFMIGAREAVVITDVQAGSPAEIAQLSRGDEIVGFASDEDFVVFTHAHQGEQATINIVRDGSPRAVQVQLRRAIEEEAPLGAAVSKVGFARLPFFSALKKGMIDSVHAVAQIFIAFGSLIGSLFAHASVPENVVGPVGIFGIAGDLGKLGFVYIIQLIAMISLNLAALNAVPFPALDGGRILFMIIEKVKGSPLHQKGEMWSNIASFGFLIILMLIITGKDIARLF